MACRRRRFRRAAVVSASPRRAAPLTDRRRLMKDEISRIVGDTVSRCKGLTSGNTSRTGTGRWRASTDGLRSRRGGLNCAPCSSRTSRIRRVRRGAAAFSHRFHVGARGPGYRTSTRCAIRRGGSSRGPAAAGPRQSGSRASSGPIDTPMLRAVRGAPDQKHVGGSGDLVLRVPLLRLPCRRPHGPAERSPPASSALRRACFLPERRPRRRRRDGGVS